MDFRKDLISRFSWQQNQAPTHPEQKKPPAAGSADTANYFIGNKALAGKAFPPDRFTGDPDDTGIRGRGNVTERKNHGTSRKSLRRSCDRKSIRGHTDRCVITIRYAGIPGKELATA